MPSGSHEHEQDLQELGLQTPGQAAHQVLAVGCVYYSCH